MRVQMSNFPDLVSETELGIRREHHTTVLLVVIYFISTLCTLDSPFSFFCLLGYDIGVTLGRRPRCSHTGMMGFWIFVHRRKIEKFRESSSSRSVPLETLQLLVAVVVIINFWKSPLVI